ncbi:MAG: RagB/SusD family nutrient uptake outer membrane protein, partial [Pedobacter sp.]
WIKAQVDQAIGGNNPAEVLWRGAVDNALAMEEDHFPPSLLGRGLLNPTQNLVDAFPMANGYPISDQQNAGYVSTAPYTGRDPRLNAYIIYNGATFGTANTTVINTALDATTNDGLNKLETSTRTGYYMRKLLRNEVNLNSSSRNPQQHIKPRMRYTEFYLAYAEAANEAWGPLGTGSHTYSAYDVIKAIRRRAGVGVNNNDPYLESIKNDKAAMQTLIRNERRLELCFEGHRFWDLRRWKRDLTETAKGMLIQAGTYTPINVDERVYQDHMIYGPVPNTEILKFSALKQNTGW